MSGADVKDKVDRRHMGFALAKTNGDLVDLFENKVMLSASSNLQTSAYGFSGLLLANDLLLLWCNSSLAALT